MTAPLPDLGVVADRLTRAADRIDKLTDVEFIESLDPHAVAALVPLLRLPAKGARMSPSPLTSNERRMADHLHTFAARVLREEETA